ncbi:MAG TPA: Maf family protein [Deltaproteobacteria bacterium]|nr:Maf family protein [Deltaproteobacteria bacterium]
MQLILASGSPRRKELLGLVGVPFDVVVTDVPEIPLRGESPVKFCSRVGREKALAASRLCPDACVIGADTIVVKGGLVLGKPTSEDEAASFLRILQGASHYVYTGYTILLNGRETSRVIRTTVRFKPMGDEDIRWYVRTGEPMDKAGAYAAQGIGSLFIERVSGSYTNVIGLPLAELCDDLRTMGFQVPR